MIKKLTANEKQSIKILNFIASYDGIIVDKEDMFFLMQQGVEKFISKRRQLSKN